MNRTEKSWPYEEHMIVLPTESLPPSALSALGAHLAMVHSVFFVRFAHGEVFDVIVARITVFMMHYFLVGKISLKEFLHFKPMLKNPAIFVGKRMLRLFDSHIAVSVNASANITRIIGAAIRLVEAFSASWHRSTLRLLADLLSTSSAFNPGSFICFVHTFERGMSCHAMQHKCQTPS